MFSTYTPEIRVERFLELAANLRSFVEPRVANLLHRHAGPSDYLIAAYIEFFFTDGVVAVVVSVAYEAHLFDEILQREQPT